MRAPLDKEPRPGKQAVATAKCARYLTPYTGDPEPRPYLVFHILFVCWVDKSYRQARYGFSLS